MTSGTLATNDITTGSFPETSLPFSIEEYQRRVDAVVSKFPEYGIEALVVTSTTSQRYLTGYHGYATGFAPFPLIITSNGDVTYVVREYEEVAIRTETWITDIVTYVQQNDFQGAWASALKKHGLERARLGLELGTWNLSPNDVSNLRLQLPDASIVDATKLVPLTAAVKSAVEIDAMRASMAVTDLAINTFYEVLRPGITEYEAEAALLAAARAKGETLRPIGSLSFGRRTALPHGHPSQLAISEGEPALIEVGGFSAGYSAGLVRSAVLGRNAAVEDLFKVAADALAAGIDATRPGARAGDVDAAVRDVVTKAGRSESFLHRAGYQNGISWSNRGYISLEPDATDVIEAAMTFHLPIILFERGQFATGVSETVLVTDSGAEALSSTSSALHRIG